MASSSEAESRAFAETRKALLAALDRTQQDAYDQAAEVIRRGERRAHEIIVESDQCAALLEEQLTYLTEQIEHVRVKVTEIRARLARESKSDKNIILGQPLPQPRTAGPDQVVPSAAPAVVSPALRTSNDQLVPASVRNEDPVQWRRTDAPLDGPAVTTPGATDPDSLHETLRTLRAALESLSGRPPSPNNGQ